MSVSVSNLSIARCLSIPRTIPSNRSYRNPWYSNNKPINPSMPLNCENIKIRCPSLRNFGNNLCSKIILPLQCIICSISLARVVAFPSAMLPLVLPSVVPQCFRPSFWHPYIALPIVIPVITLHCFRSCFALCFRRPAALSATPLVFGR